MADPKSSHVLLLPFPSQGHINPMLHFALRFAVRGLTATLAVTSFILNTTRHEPGPVHFAAISDGYDRAGYAEAESVEAYFDRFERTGSETLAALLESEAAAGRPVGLLVFDSFLPWAGDVARQHSGVATAAFLTQSSAVNLVYCHVLAGRVEMPIRAATVELPELQQEDLPSFLREGMSVYQTYLNVLLNQFKNLEKVDEILINTYYELEPKETDYLKTILIGAKTIGPTIPSMYLDNRLPSGSEPHDDLHLFTPEVASCMTWLDSKPIASVVYVAFGSMTSLSAEQMCELAFGLANTAKHFLWVVQSSETVKLPGGFTGKCSPTGLLVSWSPQLEVLAHRATGCFITHCGWNSTVEALSLGVPMVAMAQWADQPTNAKYVEDVWEVGVRVRADEEGLVRREEVERAVREVMEGGRSSKMRNNAARWSELAKAALGENGSSDKNIVELIEKHCS